MKNNLILLCIIMFCLSLVSGIGCDKSGYLGSAELRQNFTVVISCPTCDYLNFTLTSPSKQIILDNVGMLQDDNDFRYIILSENLTEIGTYFINGGDSSSPLGACFDITKNGYEISTAEVIIYFLLFSVNIIFFLFFFILSITVPFSNDIVREGDTFYVIKVTGSKYLKLMSIIFAYGLFLFLLMLLTGLTQNYINFPEMKTLVTGVFTFCYYLGYGLMFSMFWLIFILLWKDILFSKTILREGKALMREIT